MNSLSNNRHYRAVFVWKGQRVLMAMKKRLCTLEDDRPFSASQALHLTMQPEHQAPATQFISYKVSRIPSDQSQEQVQLILRAHFPGALLCLQKRKSSKSDFRSGHLTIPKSVVDSNETLQLALTSNGGTPIYPAPLPKLYLRPFTSEKLIVSQSSTESFQEGLNDLRSHVVANAECTRINNHNITALDAKIQSLQQQIAQLKFQVRPQDYQTPIISAQAKQTLTHLSNDPRSPSRNYDNTSDSKYVFVNTNPIWVSLVLRFCCFFSFCLFWIIPRSFGPRCVASVILLCKWGKVDLKGLSSSQAEFLRREIWRKMENRKKRMTNLKKRCMTNSAHISSTR